MKKLLLAAALTQAASLAAAHEGHGMDFAHWHATEVWGFLAMGVAVALVLWLRRGKR
jgi:hypothetical protein